MKTITVNLEDREVEVSKLPIGEYADLLKAIKNLPKHFNNLENLKIDDIVLMLPEIAGDSMPDLINIVAIATKLPADEVGKMGLDEIIKLVEAVYQVNNFAGVIEVLKKALAHPAVKSAVTSKTN